MKTKLVFAAAALLAGGAFAQGSTEIYGRINLTVERQKDGDTRHTGMFDNSSRIGFRGAEDLGGGLKVGFVLEHGFDADNGTVDAAFWGRESTLSLGGGFGTLRFGRLSASEAYYTSADYVSMHNHDTGSSADALYAPGFWSADQTSNSIAYTSPTIAGWRFDAQYGMKETSKTDAPITLAANYDVGALHMGLGYQDYDGNKSTALRALYELGAFTVGGYYERGSGDLKYNNFRLAGMYTMGVTELHLNFGKRSSDDNALDGDQFTVAYNYNLSKRTRLHLFYTKLDVGHGVTDFSSYGMGLRHNF